MPTPLQTLYVYPNPTHEARDYAVISEHPVFGVFNSRDVGLDVDIELSAVALPYGEIPALCARLMELYNQKTSGQLKGFGAPPDPTAEIEIITHYSAPQ